MIIAAWDQEEHEVEQKAVGRKLKDRYQEAKPMQGQMRRQNGD